MEEKSKKYKYLVTVGCSQTMGMSCKPEYHWTKILANSLNLELINLAVSSTGFHYVETIINQFIHHNPDKVKDSFFIIQLSQLARRLNISEFSQVRSDFFEKYNIRFLSQVAVSATGFWDWDKFLPRSWSKGKPKNFTTGNYMNTTWANEEEIDPMFVQFPEHRHYPHKRNPWMIDGESPPDFHDKFQELMLHWGRLFLSFHLYLKEMEADHIIVDGYSPFMSYKLNFRNYYNDDDEYDFVNRFWSNENMVKDEKDIYLYDFKNIKSGYLFDKIPIENKIDDVVLWSLFQYNADDPLWTPDGGHAGPKGMAAIYKVIKQNLKEKGWFE